MDPGYRSPLLEMFRRNEAERDVRLAGAQGLLRLQALEQIALLMILLEDEDPGVARQAALTLEKLPEGPVAQFLARPDVPDAMRDFFALRGIEPLREASQDLPEPQFEMADSDAAEAPGDEDTPAAMLSSLPVVARLKLATKGTREQRAQLIRDSNRMVAVAVLSSPKVNESEVEAFAKMANVSEEVLRIISANRSWMKHYGIALGLIKNPKTPPGISTHIMHRLTERDVKALTVDRNVPEMVRLAARRVISRPSR
ncbi:MAG: hypothetical protein ABIX28_01595 [Vicinamibacterales bacterium]